MISWIFSPYSFPAASKFPVASNRSARPVRSLTIIEPIPGALAAAASAMLNRARSSTFRIQLQNQHVRISGATRARPEQTDCIVHFKPWWPKEQVGLCPLSSGSGGRLTAGLLGLGARTKTSQAATIFLVLFSTGTVLESGMKPAAQRWVMHAPSAAKSLRVETTHM